MSHAQLARANVPKLWFEVSMCCRMCSLESTASAESPSAAGAQPTKRQSKQCKTWSPRGRRRRWCEPPTPPFQGPRFHSDQSEARPEEHGTQPRDSMGSHPSSSSESMTSSRSDAFSTSPSSSRMTPNVIPTSSGGRWKERCWYRCCRCCCRCRSRFSRQCASRAKRKWKIHR